MERTQQSHPTVHRFDTHLDRMTELRSRLHTEKISCRLISEVTETHHHAQVRQQGDFAFEKRSTRIAFGR